MNIIKPQPIELSVFVPLSASTHLIDRRIRTGGIYFGTVEEVAKNLGIKVTVTENGLICSAPKLRLQKFVERLHFAGATYSDI